MPGGTSFSSIRALGGVYTRRTRCTSGRSSTTVAHVTQNASQSTTARSTRTEVIVSEANLPVARDAGVPVGEGLDPLVDAAVGLDARGEGGAERTEDSHFGRVRTARPSEFALSAWTRLSPRCCLPLFGLSSPGAKDSPSYCPIWTR